MDGGAEFGDAAVVDLDGFGGVLEEDADGRGGVGWDAEALGGPGDGGAEDDGDLGNGLALVADLDGDQVARGFAGLGGEPAGGGLDDGEVGEAGVGVYPVVEEPGKVAVGGLFEGVLEGDGVAFQRGVQGKGAAVGEERLAEEVVSQELAQLPEDGGGFEAEEDLRSGPGKGLGGGGRVGFGERDEGGGLLELRERSVPALGLLGAEQADELWDALVEPERGGLEEGVGEGAEERGSEGFGGELRVELGDEKGGVFEGLAGVVEEEDWGGGVGGEAGGEERLEEGGCFAVGLDCLRVGGDDGEELVRGGDGALGGEEEVGDAEADGVAGDFGRGEAVSFAYNFSVGVRSCREGVEGSVDDGGVRWVADVLDGQPQAESGGYVPGAVGGGEGEELVAVAEDGGGGGDGVPEHVAEAAQGSGGGIGRGGDAVPVASGGFGGWCAEEFEAGGRLKDHAGVDGGDVEGGSGGERLGGGENSLLGIAGVVGVSGDGGLGEGAGDQVAPVFRSDCLPAEGARDLEGDAGDGGVCGIDDFEEGVGFKGGGSGDEVEVNPGGTDPKGGALGVGDGGGGEGVGGGGGLGWGGGDGGAGRWRRGCLLCRESRGAE